MTNYSICRISRTAYKPALDQLYAENADLEGASYETQSRAFFDRGLVYSDSFSRAMRGLGNVATELLCNAEHIQKAWAREHGINYSEDAWVREISLAQIESWRPDVLFIQGISTSPDGFLPDRGFREKFPFVKCVVAYSGFPHDLDRFEGVDVVISCVPELQSQYRQHGIDSHLVYHGFDDGALALLAADSPSPGNVARRPFVFSGLTGVGFGDGHISRYWGLIELMLRTPLEAWVYDRLDALSVDLAENEGVAVGKILSNAAGSISADRLMAFLTSHHDTIYRRRTPHIPMVTLFPQRCHPPVFGIDMLRLLAGSQLVYNRHTDALDQPTFGNMRLFEATGVGSCLVTDTADNVRDLFEPDSEIVTYGSIEECVEKVDYLLAHEEEARAIAEAGRRRTLSQHTIARRAEEIHGIISGAL